MWVTLVNLKALATSKRDSWRKKFKQASYLDQIVFEEWMGSMGIFQLREVPVSNLRADNIQVTMVAK